MNWQVIKIKTLLWLRRIILYSLYSLVVSSVLGFAILQIPIVQESIIARLTRNFSTVTGFKVTFDSFYLVWYDRLQIEGLNIEDPEKNTMLGVEKIYVNYSIASLVKGNDVNIDAEIGRAHV